MDYGANTKSSIGWKAAAINTSAFKGFSPLKEYGFETHISGMLNTAVDAFRDVGKAPPVFLNMNHGAGGKRISELSSGVYMDNMKKSFQLAKAEAQKMGMKISDTLVFNFIQGQSDGDNGSYYGQLKTLLGKVDSLADQVFGKNIQVEMMLSQVRGYGTKKVAKAQIDFIEDHANVHMGAAEYQFQASLPASTSDLTHLSSKGYLNMGASIGRKMAVALQGGSEEPITMAGYKKLSANKIEIRFDGVEGKLVHDPGIYSVAKQHTPQNFGFETYDTRSFTGTGIPDVQAAKITGARTVEVTFDKAISGKFQLWLGREDTFGGTTLRDSIVDQGPGAYGSKTVPIEEYAPIDWIEIA